jgi:ketosteroid isomerase-like protein
MSDNIEVVLRVFHAVERRDRDEVLGLYHPDVEFDEAPSLPYGGTQIGLRAVVKHTPSWAQTWDPVQTETERKMDPRVVAANEEEVVVLYRQRAVDSTGKRFDNPVLGLYRVRDEKLQRAQMFHFDTAAIVSFLNRAKHSSSA